MSRISEILFTALKSFHLLCTKCLYKCKCQWFITLNYCSERSVQRILEVFSTHCTKDKKSTNISLFSDFVFKRIPLMGHWKQLFGCMLQTSHLWVYDGCQWSLWLGNSSPTSRRFTGRMHLVLFMNHLTSFSQGYNMAFVYSPRRSKEGFWKLKRFFDKW